jgi:hypothetical protein
VTDGTGNENYYALPFSGHLDYPQKHAPYFRFFDQRSRPCGGTEILSSRAFPPETQGDLLLCNVIGFQGIFRYHFEDAGSGFGAHEVEPLVFSSDPSFRPVAAQVGPDGAVYFLDWYNPIIGHMQHHLRDPNRDHDHGRIYRITCTDLPTLKPKAIAGRPIAELLEVLKEPEDRVRYRARLELSGRPSAEVIAAAQAWEKQLDPKDPDYEHHRLEALWLQQQHGTLDVVLLNALLKSADRRVRAAAVQSLRSAHRELTTALEKLRAAAGDDDPRVRLEAVVAASDFDEVAAARVVLEAMRKPTDRFLDYAISESMRTLGLWRKALPRRPRRPDIRGAAFLVARDAELEKLPLDRCSPRCSCATTDERRRAPRQLAALRKSTSPRSSPRDARVDARRRAAAGHAASAGARDAAARSRREGEGLDRSGTDSSPRRRGAPAETAAFARAACVCSTRHGEELAGDGGRSRAAVRCSARSGAARSARRRRRQALARGAGSAPAPTGRARRTDTSSSRLPGPLAPRREGSPRSCRRSGGSSTTSASTSRA